MKRKHNDEVVVECILSASRQANALVYVEVRGLLEQQQVVAVPNPLAGHVGADLAGAAIAQSCVLAPVGALGALVLAVFDDVHVVHGDLYIVGG